MNLLILAAQLAQAGSDAAPAVEATDLQIQSVWDFVVKGRTMMIPIVLGSLVAFGVFVERLISLRRDQVTPPEFWPGIEPLLTADQYSDAREYCDNHPSPIARVVGAGLRKIASGADGIEKAVIDFGEREAGGLRKNVRVLAVIASVAPLMGLLGTIFGLIRAFQTVATSENALGRAELLAKGIYEAMITTAAGLLVAIPTLMAYHWVVARIERRTSELNEVASKFVDHCSTIPVLRVTDNSDDHTAAAG